MKKAVVALLVIVAASCGIAESAEIERERSGPISSVLPEAVGVQETAKIGAYVDAVNLVRYYDWAWWQDVLAWSTAYEASRRVVVARSSGSSRGGSCTPEGIAAAESGGSYTAHNSTSTASGKYQFLDSTWAGYGGYQSAADAPPEVQEAKFAETWDGGAGASHWAASVC